MDRLLQGTENTCALLTSKAHSIVATFWMAIERVRMETYERAYRDVYAKLSNMPDATAELEKFPHPEQLIYFSCHFIPKDM